MSRVKRTIEDVNSELASNRSGPSQNQDSRARFACMAHGCPMLAGIDNGGGAVCRFHADVLSERWQAITHRLNQNRWLVNMVCAIQSYDWCASNPSWPARAAAVCIERDREDLSPLERVNLGGKQVHERDRPALYAQRLDSELRAIVTDEGYIPKAKRPAGAPAVYRVGDVLPRFGQ